MCGLEQQIINGHAQRLSEKENKKHQDRYDMEKRKYDLGPKEVVEWLTKVISEKFNDMGSKLMGARKYELIMQKEDIEYEIWKIDKGLN